MDPANSLTDFEPNVTMDTAAVQQPTLDVVARPVPIRFNPPAAQRDPNMEYLARGLSAFDSGLGDFRDARQKQQDQADALQGQADFEKSHGQQYADAVQAGTVPASASPAYVRSYKEAQGTLAGQQLEQKFQAAYDAWPGKNDLSDPDAFSKFTQDFFARNLPQNGDPDVLRGLLPIVHQIADAGLRQHINDQHTSVVQGQQNTMAAIVNNQIGAAVAFANQNGGKVDPAYIASKVGDAYDTARSLGVSPDEAQRQAIVQIITAAKSDPLHHGQEILDAMDKPMPGTGLILGQTAEGAQAKLQAQDFLEAKQRENILHETEAQKQVDRQALGATTSRILDQLAKDPNSTVSEDDLRAGLQHDPTGEFRVKVAGWQKTMLESQGQSNPAAVKDVMVNIMNGGGVADVESAIEDGRLKSPEDIQRSLKFAEDHQKAGPLMGQMVESETYKSVMQTIKMRTHPIISDNPMIPVGVSDAGLGLEIELQHRMQDWIVANPSASPAQVQDQLGKTSRDILGLITQEGGANLPAGNPFGGPSPSAGSTPPSSSSPGTTPPPAAPPSPTSSTTGGATSSGQVPTPAQTAPQTGVVGATVGSGTGTQTTVTSGGGPNPAAVQQWIASLSPQQQSNLLQASIRSGRSPMDLATEQFTRLNPQQNAQQPGGASPPNAPAGSNPAPGAVAPATSGPLSTPSSSGFGPMPTSADITNSPRMLHYQPGSWEQVGDAIAKWRATDPNAEAIIHQATAAISGLHAALPYQGSTTLAAIKDNPQAARILDFVAGPESKGNYNAYWGHENNQNVNLTNMTLNEVLQFQHNLVAVQRLPSSASGRYQFMPKTLTGLMQQMHLTGNEKFTPEMQDQLALQLLKNRGMEAWQQGKLSDAGFMNNLAYEWASLPNPHTGRSQYDGDGLNHALVTPKQTQAMLNEARGAGAAPATGPAGDAAAQGAAGPNNVYGNIPAKDEHGQPQLDKFMRWNNDPIGNSAAKLGEVDQQLAAVVKQAQADNPGLKFIVGNGKRSPEDQNLAKQWGWSKVGAPAPGSLAAFAGHVGGAGSHINGKAVDLWGLDPSGKVQFDPGQQQQIADAMKKAAAKLGIKIAWGGDWQSFKDRPHFELSGGSSQLAEK